MPNNKENTKSVLNVIFETAELLNIQYKPVFKKDMTEDDKRYLIELFNSSINDLQIQNLLEKTKTHPEERTETIKKYLSHWHEITNKGEG